MPDRTGRSQRGPIDPTAYPGRYEASWRRRRPQRMYVRAALAVVAFALFVWPLSWEGGLFVAAIAWAAHFLYTWQRHRLATSWNRTAYAERRTAHALYPLESQGYTLLYDHDCGDIRIQVLVIGPTGVWLLHAVGRAPKRRLVGDAAFLHPADRPDPPAPEDLTARTRQVTEALAAELGEGVTVHPLMVVVGSDPPEAIQDAPPIPVTAIGDLTTRITTAQRTLPPDRVARATAAAEVALTSHRAAPSGPNLPLMAEKKSVWSRKRGPEMVRETEIGHAKNDDDTS